MYIWSNEDKRFHIDRLFQLADVAALCQCVARAQKQAE